MKKYYDLVITYGNLICQTVTTVGFGNFGLPGMTEKENNDILINCIMIFGGSVLFSKFMAALNVIFADQNKKMTVQWKIMKLEDQVAAFAISFNDGDHPKHLIGSDI